jgi:hypothetical protein
MRIRPAIAMLPLILLLPACGGAVADSYTIEHEPATVETNATTGHTQVRLEEQAAIRLAIATTTVVKNGDSLVVPSAAIFVDTEGAWWVYTSPEPLVFERQQIALQQEAGNLAYFSSGPPAGTKVVTTGVQELYGVEEAVGH